MAAVQTAHEDHVSVIMPCYNAEPYVEEAIDSVLRQTYPHTEVIVVDDGSQDASPDIVSRLAEEHPGRVRLYFQNRKGPYPARNLGLLHAQGAYVAFLDADDWWREDCLEKLHAELASHPEAGLAYCGWQNVGVTGGRANPYVPPDYEQEGKIAHFLRAAAPWPIHAALVRKSVMDEARGFDETLPSCMDYDLWLRIGLAYPIRRVDEVLAFYRHHGEGQITSKQWIQARNVWLVKKKFVKRFPHLVAHLSQAALRELIDGGLLRRGYENYWRRDLVSARHIFRMVWRTGSWGLKDLKYLVLALLPERLYLALIGRSDRRAGEPTR